jgi:hypothetical protein
LQNNNNVSDQVNHLPLLGTVAAGHQTIRFLFFFVQFTFSSFLLWLILAVLKLTILTMTHSSHAETDDFFHDTFQSCWNWWFWPWHIPVMLKLLFLTNFVLIYDKLLTKLWIFFWTIFDKFFICFKKKLDHFWRISDYFWLSFEKIVRILYYFLTKNFWTHFLKLFVLW